jgi:hypothetical protein
VAHPRIKPEKSTVFPPLQQSGKKDAAWNFMKWAETQVTLGNVKINWVQLGKK